MIIHKADDTETVFKRGIQGLSKNWGWVIILL